MHDQYPNPAIEQLYLEYGDRLELLSQEDKLWLIIGLSRQALQDPIEFNIDGTDKAIMAFGLVCREPYWSLLGLILVLATLLAQEEFQRLNLPPI